MRVDLPEETWGLVYHLATLGENEIGADTEEVVAFREALFAAGVKELSHGWHGDKWRPGGVERGE